MKLDVADLLPCQETLVPEDGTIARHLARIAPGAAPTERDGVVTVRGSSADVALVTSAVSSLRQRSRADALAWLGGKMPGSHLPAVFIKFTWTGTQEKPVPSLGIHAKETPFDLAVFRVYQWRKVSYGNDGNILRDLALATDELKLALEAIVKAPGAGESARREESQLSLSLIDTKAAKQPGYVELVLLHEDIDSIFDRLEAALAPKNAEASKKLRAFGVMYGATKR